MSNSHNSSQKFRGVAVITGASAGLGRACARYFAQMGYDISLLARGVDGLRGAQAEIEAMGRRAVYFSVDVADGDAVEQAAEKTELELGEIDVWVNNAMNSVFSPVKEMTPADYKRVTEVTYLGQVNGTLAALKRMLPRNRGSIVLVGSALAYRGIPLQSAYCASKHAIEGFYDSLRTELLHDKSAVKTCMVQLPAMNTTQFGFVKSRLPNKPRPMGTIYAPEVAADAIYWASQHNRREIMVGFSTVKAIVGNKIAAWYADRVLAKNGIAGQQTDQPEDPDRSNNLYHPLPGDHGAHGPFGEKVRHTSVQLWFFKHRVYLILLILLILGIAALIIFTDICL